MDANPLIARGDPKRPPHRDDEKSNRILEAWTASKKKQKRKEPKPRKRKKTWGHTGTATEESLTRGVRRQSQARTTENRRFRRTDADQRTTREVNRDPGRKSDHDSAGWKFDNG